VIPEPAEHGVLGAHRRVAGPGDNHPDRQCLAQVEQLFGDDQRVARRVVNRAEHDHGPQRSFNDNHN
jgi:hypothetical protein